MAKAADRSQRLKILVAAIIGRHIALVLILAASVMQQRPRSRDRHASDGLTSRSAFIRSVTAPDPRMLQRPAQKPAPATVAPQATERLPKLTRNTPQFDLTRQVIFPLNTHA